LIATEGFAKTATIDVRAPRFRPDDRLLAFLKSL